MATNNSRLPSLHKIRSFVLERLQYHRDHWESKDIDSYAEFNELVHAAADGTTLHLDPRYSRALENRTRAVLRMLERESLVTHWLSENWQLTDLGEDRQ